MARDFFKEALADPKPLKGAPIPLFDKLVNDDRELAGESPIKRFYNKDELIESIRDELSRILNTRAGAKRADYDELTESEINFSLPQLFGLSDFSQYDGASQSDWPRISKLCENAIERYEPRLKNAVVTVTDYDDKRAILNIIIDAELAYSVFQGEVTFPMAIGKG